MFLELFEVLLYGFIFAACSFIFEKREKKDRSAFFKQVMLCCVIIGFAKLISFFIPSSINSTLTNVLTIILIPLIIYGIIRFQLDILKDAFKKKEI